MASPLLILVPLALIGAAAAGSGTRRRRGAQRRKIPEPQKINLDLLPAAVPASVVPPGVISIGVTPGGTTPPEPDLALDAGAGSQDPDPIEDFDPFAVPEDSVVLPKQGPPLPPMWEGAYDDPEIVALHNEMNAYFAAAGLGDSGLAEDLTVLPKAPVYRRYSIPDRRYWQNMLYTLLMLKESGLGDMAIKMRGYRPPWYNEAVGGKKNSTHQWFSGVDIRRGPGTSLSDLYDAAEWLWENRAKAYNMGIGMYQNNIHVDTRRPKKRTKWGPKKGRLKGD